MNKTYTIIPFQWEINDTFRISDEDFDYAYDIFERQVSRLRELTRPLSLKEKHLLTASFNSLVDLHTLLHETKK